MNDWLRFRATVSGSVPVQPTTVSARTLGDAIEAVLLLYTRRDLEVVLRDELQLTWTDADSSPADEETKRDVIRRYTAGWGMPELVSLARRIRSELDVASEPLEPLLDAYERSGGVRSSAKNVIFAANGPKPDLVLRDALSNDIEIVRNGEYCLVYDRTLPADGLRYRHLVEWWRARESLPDTTTDQEVASALHRRLRDSLGDNGAELKVFDAYGRRYRDGGLEEHVLLPQVYLHFDPVQRRARESRGQGPGPLARQRMDFLLLFSDRRRVVIEVDGVQHYAADSGEASPARYGAMVAEDRRLRLAGYEIYRFGGAELISPDADEMLSSFFTALTHIPN